MSKKTKSTKDVQKHCHYSGLPSPYAYEQSKDVRQKKTKQK